MPLGKLKDAPKEGAVAQKINKALEDDRFKYRTINGIARETGVPEEVVLSKIKELADVIISTKTTTDGRALYTTRNHYKKVASLSERIRAVIRNKVD